MKYAVRFGALAAVLVLVGCNFTPARAVVKGKVTVGGKAPLTGGTIQFVSVSHPNVVGGGTIQADGTYQVADAPVGECKVVIDNDHLNLKKKSNIPVAPGQVASKGPPEDATKKTGTPPKVGEGTTGKADAGFKYIAINADYRSVEKTPLKTTVASGGSSTDFDVK
jgi:hypothetical protein